MASADQFVQVDALKTRLTESGNGLLSSSRRRVPSLLHRGFRDKSHPLAAKFLPD